MKITDKAIENRAYRNHMWTPSGKVKCRLVIEGAWSCNWVPVKQDLRNAKRSLIRQQAAKNRAAGERNKI